MTPAERAMMSIISRAEELIERHGWMIQYVHASEEEPTFSYTVGLTPKGLPELITFGLRARSALAILNDAAQQLVDAGHRHDLEHGDLWMGLAAGGYDPMILDVIDTTQHLTMAGRFYGESVRALQLVWPDPEHRFPWQEGSRYAGVTPLLGIPPQVTS